MSWRYVKLKRIISYLAPYKMRMALGISIKILGTLAELLIPFILTYILEHVIVTMEIPRIVLYGVIMILCSVAACVGNVTANRMAAKVTADFPLQCEGICFQKPFISPPGIQISLRFPLWNPVSPRIPIMYRILWQ